MARHTVKALPYTRKPQRAVNYAHYMAHREEGLPRGEHREVYAIGDRYKEVARQHPEPVGREAAFRTQLKADAGLVPKGAYHRHVFTVNPDAARALAGMSPQRAERVLRDAFQETLRSSALGRRLQGVYVIHWHGGASRAAHPHIHTLYSPADSRGQGVYIAPRHLEAFKRAWTFQLDTRLQRELARGLVSGRDLAAVFRTARLVGQFVRSPLRTAASLTASAAVRSAFPATRAASNDLARVAGAAVRGPRSAAEQTASAAVRSILPVSRSMTKQPAPRAGKRLGRAVLSTALGAPLQRIPGVALVRPVLRVARELIRER